MPTFTWQTCQARSESEIYSGVRRQLGSRATPLLEVHLTELWNSPLFCTRAPPPG
jgi:hypothetical protein